MPEKIQGTSNVSPYDFPAQWDDSSTTLVTLGENSLSDVAKLRNIDPAALLAANPQISDLKAPLVVGQQIQLPYCQAPVQHPEPASDSKSSSSGTSGDPLAKSVVQANLKKAEELPADEAADGRIRVAQLQGNEDRVHAGARRLPEDREDAAAQTFCPHRDHVRKVDEPV